MLVWGTTFPQTGDNFFKYIGNIVQTFLPYPDFILSARCLDDARLNKQRSETKQILNVVAGINSGSGWRHHPAVKMWRGHPRSLALYGLAVCNEHRRRGKKDRLRPWFRRMASQLRGSGLPTWVGDERFHAAHRASLLFKNLNWYSRFGWTEQPNYGYIWPT